MGAHGVHARRAGSLRERSLQAAAQPEWGCDGLWPSLWRGNHGAARHAWLLLVRSRDFLFSFSVAESAPEARTWGKSKDHRDDLPQVVIGMAVTRDGIPLRVRCWPGNTGDSAQIRRGAGRVRA